MTTFLEMINAAAAAHAGWHVAPSGPFEVFYEAGRWFAGLGPAGREAEQVIGPYALSALARRAAEETMASGKKAD